MCLKYVTKQASILKGWKLSSRPDILYGLSGTTNVGTWQNASFTFNCGNSHLTTSHYEVPYPIGFHAFKYLKDAKAAAEQLTTNNWGIWSKATLFLFQVELQGLLAEGPDRTNFEIGEMNLHTLVAARMKASWKPTYMTKLFNRNRNVHFMKYKG